MENDIDLGSLAALVLSALVTCAPVAKILSRVGFSGWWSVVVIIPFVNVLALWIFAFSKWPGSIRADG